MQYTHIHILQMRNEIIVISISLSPPMYRFLQKLQQSAGWKWVHSSSPKRKIISAVDSQNEEGVRKTDAVSPLGMQCLPPFLFNIPEHYNVYYVNLMRRPSYNSSQCGHLSLCQKAASKASDLSHTTQQSFPWLGWFRDSVPVTGWLWPHHPQRLPPFPWSGLVSASTWT